MITCVQLVIFLYLLDSETSYVVLASSGIGTVIEFWKVTKAMNVTIDGSRGFPWIRFEDKAGEHACQHASRIIFEDTLFGQLYSFAFAQCLLHGWALHCLRQTVMIARSVSLKPIRPWTGNISFVYTCYC